MLVNKLNNEEEQIIYEMKTANIEGNIEVAVMDYSRRKGGVQEINYQKVELNEYLLMMLNAGGFLFLASIVFCMAMLISTS